jgi:hypothetical protein
MDISTFYSLRKKVQVIINSEQMKVFSHKISADRVNQLQTKLQKSYDNKMIHKVPYYLP